MALTKVPSNLDSITATTQSQGDGSTNVATTAYVDTGLANLIDSAPGNLNTLNELAAAMNDNASFFSTVLPLSGGTLTGDLILGDNVKLEVGSATGGDLQIYHDGTHSYVANGTNTLYLRTASTLQIENSDGSEDLATFGVNGAVTLFHDNSYKLATTSSGINIDGGIDIKDGSSLNGTITSSSNSLTLNARNTGDLLFQSGGNEKVRFANSGNVGIGTASPGSLLTVEGDIRQTTGDFLYSGGGNWDIKHLADDQNIVFYTSQSGSATEKMRIRANGNVGIGETSPDRNLVVKSTSTSAAIKLVNSSSAALSMINFTNADVDFGNSHATGNLTLYTNNGNANMIMSDTGNLYLTGGNDRRIKLGDSGIAGESDSNNTVHIRGDNDFMKLMAAGNGGFIFEENGTERFKIASGGVITQSTGPATAGAVGTYALLWRVDSGSGYGFGDTIAGSNLRAASTYHNGAYSNWGYGSTSVSGTWRCMGNTGVYNGGTAYNSTIWMGCTVWVRVS